MTTTLKVLPRDVQPGDIVTRRYGRNINERFIDLPVKDVIKRRQFDHTAYRIRIDVPDHLRNLVAGYFDVSPRQTVEVKR